MRGKVCSARGLFYEIDGITSNEIRENRDDEARVLG